jgi:transposase-like protein
MADDTPSPLNNVITIDDERIKNHLDRVVRGSVEETLNALLDAEADRLCNVQRYERSEARRDTRAGHYERKLHTKAGEVRLKVPKLRQQTICEGAKEDKAGWSGFLKHLKERGLMGVRLIISDACIGLAESAAEFFPDAAWQRCIVHWYRNIFSHVPSTMVAGDRGHAQGDPRR